jgi:succinate dehydrogenase (ubiquinone) membrane anchor subunit
MAASLRPTLMRHALAAPAQRSLTSAVMPAFRVQRSQPILKSIPRATFQTSAARHILPPLPQVIRGGMNDAAPTPAPHPAHGSYHWSFERCDIGIFKS